MFVVGYNHSLSLMLLLVYVFYYCGITCRKISIRFFEVAAGVRFYYCVSHVEVYLFAFIEVILVYVFATVESHVE